MYITLGTFRWWIRNLDRGNALAALIPILNAGKQIKKTKGFKDFNAKHFHMFWEMFLYPLKQCVNNGGFDLVVGGVNRHFLPCIAYFIQDAPEGALLAGCKLGSQVPWPCRVCWVPLENANDPRADYVFREEVGLY